MDLLTRNKALFENIPANEFFTPLAEKDISTSGKKRPLFILDDNYLGFGIKTGTLSGCDDTTIKRLSQFFANNWPKETIIQFNLFASPDIYPYTRAYKAAHIGSNPILNELAYKRSEHFEYAGKDVIDDRDLSYLYLTLSLSL